MTRRQFLMVLAGAIVIVVTIIFTLTLQRPDNTTTKNTPKASTKGLTITNAKQYENKLDWSVFSSIQKAAYERIVAYGHAGTYQGTIRDNSFQMTYHPYEATTPPTQVPLYEFILDIPEAKQTYKISFAGGENYPYRILYVLCPDAGDLKYGDFGCTDEQ